MLSRRHKLILWTWIVILVSTGIFPPWVTSYSNRPAGYFLLFGSGAGAAHVDIWRLLIEWVLLTVVAGGLWFAWPDRKVRDEK